MWGYLAWGIFWLSAAAGLLMSDKTSSSEEALPVLPRTRIAFDSDLESTSTVTAGASGSSDLRVALRLPESLAGADAVRTWIAEGPQVDLEVVIAPKGGTPRTVEIPV